MRAFCALTLTLLVILTATPVGAQTQTAFCSGYRENPSAEFDYSGTWSNATGYGFGWYGNNIHYSVQATARVAIYTCASAGTVILYYFRSSNYGTVDILLDGAAYGIINQNATGNSGRNYIQIDLAYGNHTIELVNRVGGQWINIDAAEVVARAVAPTVVLFLPTHTPTFTPSPTPTSTPTPTNTPGPSPTPTLTASPTANYLIRQTVVFGEESQDVGIVYQLNAGDVGIMLLLALALMVYLVQLVVNARRGK